MAKITTGTTDGDIKIVPNGTGKTVVGTGAANATVQSSGNYDLVLQTGNATTGSITITDGASGNIAITPNGTGEVDISKVDIDGGAIDGTTIGGTTPAAGTFTTFTSTGIDDNASSTALTIDSSGNVGIGTSPTAKLSIQNSSESASPSRTLTDYQIKLTAAMTNTYNHGICATEGGFANAAITPIDTGGGGAQGWAFITGDNTSIAERMRIDSSGNVQIANSLTAGTIGSGVSFPAGHIVQVKRDKSAETNTLTTSYPTNAFYELGITVKTSSPDIWWIFNSGYYATQSFGVQFRVSTSSPVTSSDTLIWDEQTSNATGPYLAGIATDPSYGILSMNSIYESTASSGNTLYFGFFARKYSTGTVEIAAGAGSPVTQGTIAFTLIEVQG